MARRMIDFQLNEHGSANAESCVPSFGLKQPSASKEAALGVVAYSRPITDVDCPKLKQFFQGEQEVPQQQVQSETPTVLQLSAFSPFQASFVNTSSGGPSVAHSLEKPVKSKDLFDLNQPADDLETDSPVTPKTNDQHFKEWCLSLQDRLSSYDNDAYVNMLQASSSATLSRIAAELEEKAGRLAHEESKELQRMKDLNILGIASKYNASPSSAQFHKGNGRA